jgi:ketosteroid isomerase-like protein
MRLLASIFAAVLVAVPAALPVAAQTASPADAIRAARAVSNKSWADRDLAAYTATITSDFTITTGGGTAYTHDAFLALLATEFPSPSGQRCLRTPDAIELSASNPLAAEHGHWRCTAQLPDGSLVATGTYLAMWRREAGVWKTRSELFVRLACSGSSACTPKP